jgi:hypothetical protein
MSLLSFQKEKERDIAPISYCSCLLYLLVLGGVVGGVGGVVAVGVTCSS